MIRTDPLRLNGQVLDQVTMLVVLLDLQRRIRYLKYLDVRLGKFVLRPSQMKTNHLMLGPVINVPLVILLTINLRSHPEMHLFVIPNNFMAYPKRKMIPKVNYI